MRRIDMRRQGRMLGSLIAAAVSVLVLTPTSQAEIFEVTNTEDDQVAPPPGSLRAAIVAANAEPNPPHLIDATGVSGEITLTNHLQPTGEFEIRGPGAEALTVRRGPSGLFRVFTVGAGADITISGLTIADGLSPAFGGGILNNGTLTVERARIVGNTAQQGGGIRNATNATLSVLDSTVSENTAGTVTGASGGGGISNFQGVAVIRNSTVTGNNGGDSRGGGLINDVGAAPFSGTLSIANSTVAANTSDEGANLYNSSGGGPANLTFRSTIVADPIGDADNCASAGSASFNSASQGFNVSDEISCALTATADRPNTNPLLGPLQDNGGPTETMALASNSPAIDKGVADGLTADQRGLTRPIDFAQVPNAPGGDGTDIGAYEVQTLPPPPPPPTPEPPVPPGCDAFTLGKAKKNKERGTAKLTVTVPCAGQVELARTKKLKPQAKRAEAAGDVKLMLRPKGKAKERLDDTGSTRVKAEVTYTPDDRDPSTKSKRVKLKKRR